MKAYGLDDVLTTRHSKKISCYELFHKDGGEKRCIKGSEGETREMKTTSNTQA
jgi:hypothetical protein